MIQVSDPRAECTGPTRGSVENYSRVMLTRPASDPLLKGHDLTRPVIFSSPLDPTRPDPLVLNNSWPNLTRPTIFESLLSQRDPAHADCIAAVSDPIRGPAHPPRLRAIASGTAHMAVFFLAHFAKPNMQATLTLADSPVLKMASPIAVDSYGTPNDEGDSLCKSLYREGGGRRGRSFAGEYNICRSRHARMCTVNI